MQKNLRFLLLLVLAGIAFSCKQKQDQTNEPEGKETGEFNYIADQFADLRILRYQVPGFEELPLQQKKLLYYLYEAALSGRDIIYDQNYRHNLKIRKTLEAIVDGYEGDKNADDWNKFMVYTKRVWFSNGIHHHYSTEKIMPEFGEEYFKSLMTGIDPQAFPLTDGQTAEQLFEELRGPIFDPEVDAKRVNKDHGVDPIAASANNYYAGMTEKEVDGYYAKLVNAKDPQPISWGLNSQLAKEDGQIRERVYKVGGMYGQAIEKMVFWLKKAAEVAENDIQQQTLLALAKYYETGDLKDFDAYNISWVADTSSSVDVINGFIEVYGDPIGMRGAFESVVSVKDPVASKRIVAISKEAQWFEDHSPIMDQHKKKNVKGISAKVINVVVESGDAAPSTPIGINLPNANWIRKEHGSKSVNLGNIVGAYEEASRSSGFLEEFAYDEAEVERAKKYGSLADNLHTDMHEVIGHASGQLEEGTSSEALKTYSSTLEEGRADLVALYYLYDQKLVDMGLMESLEVGKAAYDDYIRNGLMTQLVRLEVGDNIEEDHMRNRQLVAGWVYEKGKADNVIEKKQKDGKSYFVINDYEKLRVLFGELLKEIQRIKSQGDYEAGKDLVETYGVKVDQELHAEVLERYKKLEIAPYAGFIQPKLVPVEENGEIVDVKIEYPEDFTEQMMFYGKNYSFLPVEN